MSARTAAVAAVDLGASSGRVMLGRVGAETLELTEISRFANEPVTAHGTLQWDIRSIYREVLAGLRRAGPVQSIGIDSWAVDYGLLDADGQLLANPVHYRDTRTDGVLEQVLAEVPAAELYGLTGLQLLPFNTVFQVVSARLSGQLAAARTLLLIPDLLTYWLTGELGTERTNASTTGLLDSRTGAWSIDLMRRLRIEPSLFPALRDPGTAVGRLRPELVAELGADDRTEVVAVASHDTASAVVGVPAQTDRFAYISCGTWSLVGLELSAPVLSADSLAANFTNEVGLDGTIRYLRNVIGLWPLQECLRAWQAAGVPVNLPDVLGDAALVPPFTAVVDLDAPLFLPPGDMPARISAECRRLGQTPPAGPAEIVRCILDSLALAHSSALADARRLADRDVDVVHIVGGGARNGLLCQLTADACGLPVLAGPEEATAIGNVLVQARALGLVEPDLAHLRDLVRRTHPVRRFDPRGGGRAWAEAAARIGR